MTYPTAKLGDVAEFIRGITFKPDDVVPLDKDDAVVCMRTKNVQALLDCDDLLAVPSQFVRRKDQYLEEGDILVSSANSWNLVGKCCWIPNLPWRAAFGGFISVLRGDSAYVDRRYLYWWFASDRIQALLRSFGQKTTNISNLNIERCLQLDLPLPSIPEQRRIAAILDQADALRTKRREALTQLDRLAQSIFVETLNQSSSKLRWLPIEDCMAAIIDYRGKTPEKTESGIPLVTAKVVKGGELLEPTEFIEEREYDTWMRRGLPKEGDVLFTTEAPLGEVAQLDSRKVALAQRLLMLRGKPEILDNGFLMFALTAPDVKKQIFSRATGSTVKGIRQSELRQVALPVPPLEVQRQFNQRIGAINRSRNHSRDSLGQIEQLFEGLQHRAFRGEL